MVPGFARTDFGKSSRVFRDTAAMHHSFCENRERTTALTAVVQRQPYLQNGQMMPQVFQEFRYVSPQVVDTVMPDFRLPLSGESKHAGLEAQVDVSVVGSPEK